MNSALQRSIVLVLVLNAVRPQKLAFAIHFTLQHVLRQQVPADETGEHMVLRLLRSRSQTQSCFRIVALVHRSPLPDVGHDHASQNAGQLCCLFIEAVAFERDVIEMIQRSSR